MANPPSWLQDIQLITFDCFGTLLDWRAALEKVEIRSREDFDAFQREAVKLQESEQHARYTDVIKASIAKVKPQIRPAIIGLFADDFGRIAPFPDAARAIATLRDAVKVGVLANCDAGHQLDVISTLRVPWDVCITSQEVRAYKPADRAWDAMLRIGVARSAATRDAWMHCSAYDRMDLVPARARGLRTCFVKRNGGDEKAGTPDLSVGGLDELAALVLAAKKGPLLLEVESVCTDAGVADKLRAWILDQQLPALRTIPGVRAAQLVEREDGVLVEHYVFGGRHEYDNYVASYAAEHRAAVRDAFGRDVERTARVSSIRGRT